MLLGLFPFLCKILPSLTNTVEPLLTDTLNNGLLQITDSYFKSGSFVIEIPIVETSKQRTTPNNGQHFYSQ